MHQSNPSLEEKLFEALKTYCIEGNNEKLYEISRKDISKKVPGLLVSDPNGYIFHPDNPVKRVRTSRNISKEEIEMTYKVLTEHLETMTRIVKSNKEKVKDLKVNKDDLNYIIKGALSDAFRMVYGDTKLYILKTK